MANGNRARFTGGERGREERREGWGEGGRRRERDTSSLIPLSLLKCSVGLVY